MGGSPQRRGILVVSLWLAGSSWGLAAADPFTLERVMGSPFPSDLTASPSGAKVAWVVTTRGVRNLWVAEPPDYAGRAVTRNTEDDGVLLGGLAWTPDARAIVYVRGADANRQGEFPNPSSRPEGAEQAVLVQPIDDGAAMRLGDGRAPAVSPKGDGVAFVSKGQVLWAPLDGSGKATPLLKLRGQNGALSWSPDGARLAFVSVREDHSFVGVYDVAAKSVRWMDPAFEMDREPVWSPDGRQVGFLRTPSMRGLPQPFGARREGEPWSIRVADVATGRARELFRAAAGRGSVFRGVLAPSQLLWSADDRIVFPWEKEGWTHLYSVPASGGAAVALTAGEFEVEQVAPSADGRHVVFSSNQGDIERRHLWTVPTAGGRPAPLTTGAGLEWSPAPTSDGKATAFFRSDTRRPAHVAMQIDSAAARELSPGSLRADFPADAMVAPKLVDTAAIDGMTAPAHLFLPPDIRPGERRPAVVHLHGGPRNQMLLGWHPARYYHFAYALNQYLVSRGFVVLSLNYRAGTGYGLDFREALRWGASGASEVSDVIGAGLYLRSRPDVDPARIGLWGGSYGGYLTALGLARGSDLFAAGVDIHGIHDWNLQLKSSPSYDPVKDPDIVRLAFESSPISAVASWRSPVLLIHGDDDGAVSFSQSVELAAALRKHRVPFEQLAFPDEAHSFLTHARWLQAFDAAADFLDRHLRRRP